MVKKKKKIMTKKQVNFTFVNVFFVPALFLVSAVVEDRIEKDKIENIKNGIGGDPSFADGIGDIPLGFYIFLFIVYVFWTIFGFIFTFNNKVNKKVFWINFISLTWLPVLVFSLMLFQSIK